MIPDSWAIVHESRYPWRSGVSTSQALLFRSTSIAALRRLCPPIFSPTVTIGLGYRDPFTRLRYTSSLPSPIASATSSLPCSFQDHQQHRRCGSDTVLRGRRRSVSPKLPDVQRHLPRGIQRLTDGQYVLLLSCIDCGSIKLSFRRCQRLDCYALSAGASPQLDAPLRCPSPSSSAVLHKTHIRDRLARRSWSQFSTRHALTRDSRVLG